MLTEQFFMYTQQDIKLLLIPAILCAIYRAIFIKVFCPYPSLAGKGKIIRQSFNYGFWWGLDINAYVILVSWILVTLPSLYFTSLPADTIKTVLMTIYGLIIYAAFAGKMIFYKHFNDTYNYMVHYGNNAEKNNLIDIFFNQDRGALVLAGFVPAGVVTWFLTNWLLLTPVFTLPHFDSLWALIPINVAIVLGTVACFYWFRFGGTFAHRNKPEWDMMPIAVKEDIFFAKATVDDLVALKIVYKQPLHEEFLKSEEEMAEEISKVIPEAYRQDWQDLTNPLEAFKRVAQGPRIQKPKHIFFVVGESTTQWSLDETYAPLHVAEGLRNFAHDSHTMKVDNFLPAGNVSRPSISSLLSGIFDAGLELNERESFWKDPLITSLPAQMKKLGYQTIYWYGGNASNGNFNKYGIGQGFDCVENAWLFCGEDAPRTWVGVYDHVFLEEAAKRIARIDEPTFHFVYTTTNHGPYKLEDDLLDFNPHEVMDATVGEDIKGDKRRTKELGTYRYCDKAMFGFIEKMKALHPDSLFVVTGDHSALFGALNRTSLIQRDYSNREKCCTVGLVQHPELDQSMIHTKIASHMNLMPTIIEAIAPKGFEYYSIAPSLFEEERNLIVTPYQWMTENALGHVMDDYGEPNTDQSEAITPIRPVDNHKDIADSWKMLAAWLVKGREGKTNG